MPFLTQTLTCLSVALLLAMDGLMGELSTLHSFLLP